MAPRLRLGVGASCTVKLRFLHPKDKVNEKVPNQSASQSISGLIVQSKAEKSIRKAAKSCFVFRHEDFGGQLVWALPRYVTVDVQGPEQSFFAEEPQQPTTRAAGDGDSAVPPSGTAEDNPNRQNDATTTGTTTVPEDLPTVIQDLMERGVGAMDTEEIGVASAAAPMVDDDNEPAPENRPTNGELVDDIFSGWTHSGICERKALISRNAKPELSFWTNKSVEPSNLQIWEGLFVTSFIKRVILPQTNNNLPVGEKQVQYGEFLRWIGLWMLMGTLIGPQRNEFWVTHTINAFHGAPLRLGIWMSRKRFDAILSALSFTDATPPTYLDKFWEIRQMVEAWGLNMVENFIPGYVNCLDESMSVWTNKFTCPGFMFVPRKPWPFGSEYHTVCCCTSGIMWGIDLVEGKDRPRALGQQQFDDMGSTVGLLLRMLTPIFHKGYVVILDSGFCVLKGIIELRKKGVFASALIKKRQYWPKFIRGDDIKAHFDNKEVGETDSWAGKLDNIPFHVYAMKEPDYVMSLMSTYGTNNRDNGKETRRSWKVGGEARSTSFRYPEVVHNHFLYRHAVDDHNGKRHSPISLEVVWATKRWPNRVFAFLMSITEVNCYLAESYFTSRKSNSMLDFRKSLAHQLIENEYFDQEAESQRRRSTRIQEGIGHGLMSLPPFKIFLGGRMVPSDSKYPPKKCNFCRREVRTYCKCTPGVHICSHCFADHIQEADNPL